MGFSWNGIHTSELGILTELRTLPVYPEPKIVTEEIAGRDGFFDFSRFNPNRRIHYRPREWEYRCSYESRIINNIGARVAAVTKLLSAYSGYLIDDKCKNVRWQGIITNKINFTEVASTLHNFAIFIRTQAFAEGLENIVKEDSINGNKDIVINNPGTWYVLPKIFITGQVDNMKLGTISVPYDGNVINQLIDGTELVPGENNISVTGFTGTIKYEFRPLYIWGWD